MHARLFVQTEPACEKALSQLTLVPGIHKIRRASLARRLYFLLPISFHHTRELVTLPFLSCTGISGSSWNCEISFLTPCSPCALGIVSKRLAKSLLFSDTSDTDDGDEEDEDTL